MHLLQKRQRRVIRALLIQQFAGTPFDRVSRGDGFEVFTTDLGLSGVHAHS